MLQKIGPWHHIIETTPVRLSMTRLAIQSVRIKPAGARKRMPPMRNVVNIAAPYLDGSRMLIYPARRMLTVARSGLTMTRTMLGMTRSAVWRSARGSLPRDGGAAWRGRCFNPPQHL